MNNVPKYDQLKKSGKKYFGIYNVANKYRVLGNKFLTYFSSLIKISIPRFIILSVICRQNKYIQKRELLSVQTFFLSSLIFFIGKYHRQAASHHWFFRSFLYPADRQTFFFFIFALWLCINLYILYRAHRKTHDFRYRKLEETRKIFFAL